MQKKIKKKKNNEKTNERKRNNSFFTNWKTYKIEKKMIKYSKISVLLIMKKTKLFDIIMSICHTNLVDCEHFEIWKP